MPEKVSNMYFPAIKWTRTKEKRTPRIAMVQNRFLFFFGSGQRWQIFWHDIHPSGLSVSSRYVMPMWSLYHWWQHIESPLTNCPKRISWAMVPCWRCRNIHIQLVYIFIPYLYIQYRYIYIYIIVFWIDRIYSKTMLYLLRINIYILIYILGICNTCF